MNNFIPRHSITLLASLTSCNSDIESLSRVRIKRRCRFDWTRLINEVSAPFLLRLYLDPNMPFWCDNATGHLCFDRVQKRGVLAPPHTTSLVLFSGYFCCRIPRLVIYYGTKQSEKDPGSSTIIPSDLSFGISQLFQTYCIYNSFIHYSAVHCRTILEQCPLKATWPLSLQR